LSDPGQHLIQLAHESGIRVEPIPGPSAVAAAVSASGFRFESFVFLGFPPTRSAERVRWFDRLARAGEIADLAVFYEAPHRIQATLADLHGRFGSLDVFLARELTKAHESLTRTTLPVTVDSRGEFTVVVDIGQITVKTDAGRASPKQIAAEFGDMTELKGKTRRQAISAISRKYGLPARDVFAALETAKNSVG
jgi:16S rRNA (cytidine1402-2'-O)-methyltransferase